MNFLFSTLLFFCASAQNVFAQAPTPPGLEYLYTANATLGAPIVVGPGPQGTRTVIPITGGTISGPKVSGQILDLGADWGWAGADGTFRPDTRYQLQTGDGANIFIRTEGAFQTDGVGYLRVRLETGSPLYYWLNDIIAVGILRTTPEGNVAIETWQINSPAA